MDYRVHTDVGVEGCNPIGYSGQAYSVQCTPSSAFYFWLGWKLYWQDAENIFS